MKLQLLAILFLIASDVMAQNTKAANGDYEFILTSAPYLSQLYPTDKKLPSKGGTFYALSFDGRYAFVYNNEYCGYYDVPQELRSGFDSSVKDLQKENSTLYWQRVKQIMADIDKNWENADSTGIYGNETADTVCTDQKAFDVVENMPSFPGGMTALMQYLSSNMHYPPKAQKNGIQGRVLVTFIVETDGSISNAKIVRSVHPLLDEEALRLTNSMPKWTPGTQNGEKVRVKFTLPMIFRMQ